MLPLGHIGIRAERGDDRSSNFTHDEQQTLMSLWSIFRSPLMFGGDLPSSDAFAISLLTNPEVLEVNQHSSGGHQVYHKGDTIGWTAASSDLTSSYVAVFNVADTKQDIQLSWSDLGLNAKKAAVRDLWAGADLGDKDGVRLTLAPHASVLYKVAAK